MLKNSGFHDLHKLCRSGFCIVDSAVYTSSCHLVWPPGTHTAPSPNYVQHVRACENPNSVYLYLRSVHLTFQLLARVNTVYICLKTNAMFQNKIQQATIFPIRSRMKRPCIAKHPKSMQGQGVILWKPVPQHAGSHNSIILSRCSSPSEGGSHLCVIVTNLSGRQEPKSFPFLSCDITLVSQYCSCLIRESSLSALFSQNLSLLTFFSIFPLIFLF